MTPATNRATFSLRTLFTVAMMAVPGIAISQEFPFDYQHASSCFGDQGTRATYGSSADQNTGTVNNPDITSPQQILFCPISRIYPRHPGRLLEVFVDIYASSVDPPRYIQVCALAGDISRSGEVPPYDLPVCTEPKKVTVQGRQIVHFDKKSLAKVITVPFGWDNYMYITVAQRFDDRLYGYRTDFNLSEPLH